MLAASDIIPQLVSLLFFLSFVPSGVHSLSALLKDYEKLDYLPVRVTSARSKRDTRSAYPPTADISFRSHDRNFHLKLSRDDTMFGSDHMTDLNGVVDRTVENLRPNFFYDGYVEGERGSRAWGSLLDGVFDGHIHFADGSSFHVEKATKFLDKVPDDFHSIVYEDSSIDSSKLRVKRALPKLERDAGDDREFAESDEPSGSSCGLSSKTADWMASVQRSAEEDSGQTEGSDLPYAHFADPFHSSSLTNDESPFDRYKRQTNQPAFTIVRGKKIYNVRTCSLYLLGDHKLYEHVYSKEGQHSASRTREEVLALFYNHIKAVNHIYESADFDGIRGINFQIQRTSLYNGTMCNEQGDSADPNYHFCPENVDVSNYLNLNSKANHSAFCLAYAVTYRDFVGGTLGLAWVASPQPNTAGGVCQLYQQYNENARYMRRSLNTGIVTLVNYGNRVPARVSQLTLAHEIGHNFGSPHDYPQRCQPGLPDGNFIMFSSATSGDKRNNAKFSQCSIARSTSFCGNSIWEKPNEDCDCGFTAEDCAIKKDKCCYPHEVVGKGCQRKKGQNCSPSEGPCCDGATCGFKSRRARCREPDECTYAQSCAGNKAECSTSPPKPNDTPCQENTKVCLKGSCNGSLCEFVGLKECFIVSGSPDEKCQLACQKNGQCMSSFALAELKKYYQMDSEGKPRNGIVLRPGSPCDNYKGYCDIFRKCRSVDSNGPLSRLKKLLFNDQTLETVSDWIQEHWYIAVLLGIGLVLVMAVFIKCCAVHTPSTNPNKPPAHNIYETLRHPTSLMHSPRRQANGAAPPSSGAHQRRSHGGGNGGRRRRSRDAAAGGGGRSSRAPAVPETAPPARPSAPPAAAPPPTTVIVVEPPPAYSASDPHAIPAMPPGGTAGGPPRGHRKHRNKPGNNVEMR